MEIERSSVEMPDIEALLALYDENRFLDAYEATRSLWMVPGLAADLPVPTLVHAGRLAMRVGGTTLGRWLHRAAARREPDHPLVRYYQHGWSEPGGSLLTELRLFERVPDLASGGPQLDAHWIARGACLLSATRDFKGAHAALARARTVCSASDPWLQCCTAHVLCEEGNWQDAAAAAQDAWSRARGMPGIARVLGQTLARSGRLDEAVRLLCAAAGNSQSFEVVEQAVFYLCMQAERSEQGMQKERGAHAYDIARRFEHMAPLADRGTKRLFSFRRLDAAQQMEDRALVALHAAETDYPACRSMAENMGKNPAAARLLLPVRHIFQKRDTCLPTSLAVALAAFKVTLDMDELETELTFGGTPLWRMVEWLEAHGFTTAQFIAEPKLCRALLEAGVPFVFSLHSLTSSHACAAIGFDAQCGVLIAHDPSAERFMGFLVDAWDEDERPFGPEALAAVPTGKKALLDAVPETARGPVTLFTSFTKALRMNGPVAAGAVLGAMQGQYPGHPFTRRAEAIHLGETGRVNDALAIQRGLLDEHPSSILIRREMLWNLNQTCSRAQIRETLAHLVERGCLPGISVNEPWRHTPAVYLSRYADQVGGTSEGYKAAECLLHKAIRLEPFEDEAYHLFGDILMRQGRFAEAVMPFRIAALLEQANEHYALSTFDALRLSGRNDDGIAFLRWRVETLGDRPEAGTAWATLIAGLEQCGQPAEAAGVMRAALEKRPDDCTLQAFAGMFWVRMGHWDIAAAALETARGAHRRSASLEATVFFHRRSGAWKSALDACAEWMAEEPYQAAPRREYLSLLACRDGRHAALDLARQWKEAFTNHDEFNELYYSVLQQMPDMAAREAFVRGQLERNAEDTWAWRELAHCLLDRAERAGAQVPGELESETATVVARCASLCPDHPSTCAVMARHCCVRGRTRDAIEWLVKGIMFDPGFEYGYRTAFDLSALLPEGDQRAYAARLGSLMLQQTGILFAAHELCTRIAQRFGVREAAAALAHWRERRPDDPKLIEIQARLMLEYGRGRSDAVRATELLRPAIERYPYHQGLRLALATACDILQNNDEQEAVLAEILRRDPLCIAARQPLARLLVERGTLDDAVTLLAQGVEFDPLDVGARHALITLLLQHGETAKAVAECERTLALQPEQLGLRRMVSDLLLDARDEARAIAVARAGVAAWPGSAYCRFLLAHTLERCSGTNAAEIEREYRAAAHMDARLGEAVLDLACFIGGQRRHAEARALLDAFLPLAAEPWDVLGARAWLHTLERHRSAAIAEMQDTLAHYPHFTKGWWFLLDWFEQSKTDDEWRSAATALSHVPAVLAENATFRARRLDVLGKAGKPEAELDAEWRQLMSDFPENETVHEIMFDMHAARTEWPEAGEIIRHIEEAWPRSAHIRARKIQWLAATRQKDEALAAATALWQMPGDDGWPEQAAWQALMDGSWHAEATRAAFELVLSGVRIRRAVFTLMLENARYLDQRAFLFRPFTSFRGGPVWHLNRLVAALDTCSWDDGSWCAMVLKQLAAVGDPKAVARFRRSHATRCIESTPLWQVIGLCYVNRSQWRKAWSWLASWRDHDGMDMWMLANYVMSLCHDMPLFNRRAHWRGVFETCRDGLERLRADYTARFIATTLCATALRLHLDAEFVEHAGRYHDLLADTSDRHWMPPRDGHVPALLLLFHEAMTDEAPDVAALAKRFRGVAWLWPWSWVRREWRRVTAARGRC